MSTVQVRICYYFFSALPLLVHDFICVVPAPRASLVLPALPFAAQWDLLVT
jgi:hypothetical protein